MRARAELVPAVATEAAARGRELLEGRVGLQSTFEPRDAVCKSLQKLFDL